MANRQDDKTTPAQQGSSDSNRNSDMGDERVRGLGEEGADASDDDEFEDSEDADEEEEEGEGSF